MEQKYTDERAVQILVSLLKQHGIKKIIASPGATNITFVATVMHDPWFEIFSSVDERSAAYIACGLAEESGEPVVISCTGATASRNYMPGLTEAYYRKLPILAVTSSQPFEKIGHLSPQLLDRSNVPNDVARRSFTIRAVKDAADEWAAEIAANSAILELSRHGGGPVHIDLQTTYSRTYSNADIRPARKISRITLHTPVWPELDPSKRVAIFVGSHSPMSPQLTDAIDRFCESHDAVVMCDHTSNYHGRFRVAMSLPFEQREYSSPCRRIDLLIHMGEVSGDYPTTSVRPANVWRLSPDGEIRDSFRTLTNVFEMPEADFFNHYAGNQSSAHTFLDECRQEYENTARLIPDLPFSNGWIAQQTAHRMPAGAVVHLGILNTLRNWNYFPFPESVHSNCNVGGFGIDGCVSSLLGAALAGKEKLYFAIVGDLAFFYDLNAIGNRHTPRNMRVMVINNGRGTEFRNYNHTGAAFGDESDLFIAAAGHFGHQSRNLLRHYAEDLGFEYLSASSKDEYLSVIDRFITPEITDKPMLLEVFTDSKDESDALYAIQHIRLDAKSKAREMAKNMLGEKGIKKIKSILGK